MATLSPPPIELLEGNRAIEIRQAWVIDDLSTNPAITRKRRLIWSIPRKGTVMSRAHLIIPSNGWRTWHDGAGTCGS